MSIGFLNFLLFFSKNSPKVGVSLTFGELVLFKHTLHLDDSHDLDTGIGDAV